MHLVGLRITNWARFRGEHEIELGPGVYAVVADHDGDPGKSNGRGKTAFLEALRWLLEGGKALDWDTLNELITNGEDEMKVEAEFSNGVFVGRTKHRNDSVKLIVIVPDETAPNGERTLNQDDAQAELDKIVGLSSTDRATTCFAEQQAVGMLLKMTTGTSTAMFESWLELERVGYAQGYAQVWLKEKTDALVIVDGEIAAANALLSASGWPTFKDAIDATQEKWQLLENDADADDAEYDRVLKLRADHQLARELAELNEEYVELCSTKQFDGEVLVATKKARDAASNAREISRTNVNAATTERDRLDRLVRGKFDGACPVSPGFACPVRAQIDARKAENAAALKVAQTKLDEVNTAALPIEETFNKARHKHEAALSASAVADERGRRIVRLRERRQDARFIDVKPLVRNDDGEFPPEPEIVSPGSRTEAAALKNKLDELEAAAAKYQAALAKSTDLTPEVIAHRLAWRILGPEVTRRQVVEGAVATVVQDANDALAAADLDLWVEPSWGRELGKPADNCADCGTPFPASARVKVCPSCGEPRGTKVKHEFRFRVRSTTSGVSGGNRDVAGIALRSAAFRWLKSRRGAEWGVALLDEPLAQLDDSNRAAMVASVARLLGSFEQCFLTAHHRGALDAMPKRIKITGSGLDSKIEVV